MKQHRKLAMGFDQDKTPHHFNLTAGGGSIAVEANDAADGASRYQIRAHLTHSEVAAVHEFLTYPVKEHATGDPLSLQDT